MKILVIGASSYVGSYVYDFLRKQDGFELFGTFFSNQLFPELARLDISDKGAVEAFVSELRPDAVFLASALAGVGDCENDPAKARAVNVEGMNNVVLAANAVGAGVVYTSTEVAGTGSVYGSTKKEAEGVLQSADRFAVLRLTMCFGLSPNRVTPRSFNRIADFVEKGEVVVCDSSYLVKPTWLKAVAVSFQELVSEGLWGLDSFVFVDRLVSRFEIARDVCTPLGFAVEEEDLARPNSCPVPDDALVDERLPKFSYEEMVLGLQQDLQSLR